MTNKKNLFIGKLQPNIIKEFINRKNLIFRGIRFVCFSYIDKNKNLLNTRIDDVLYLSQACLNFISLDQLSEKDIDFKAVGNRIILYCWEKTITNGVWID